MPTGASASASRRRRKGDLAFVQHMVATINMTGMLGVVMPHGVLFRGGAEGEIRKGLLKEDLVEAVIGLPSNLFYGTGIPAAILVLNRAKPPERKGKVLFIDAVAASSRRARPRTTCATRTCRRLRRPSTPSRTWRSTRASCRLEEIEKNDFNLNISRYVETARSRARCGRGRSRAQTARAGGRAGRR